MSAWLHGRNAYNEHEHLWRGGREDAVGFLAVLMAAAPQQVASRFLAPALQHYASLLAPAQRARSVQAGSASAMLRVRDVIGVHGGMLLGIYCESSEGKHTVPGLFAVTYAAEG